MDEIPQLPARSLSRLESTRAQAEKDFIEKKNGVPTHNRDEWIKAVDELVAAYIHRAFFAFVEEACRAAREGHWSAEQVRRSVESHLAVAIDRACDEIHPRGTFLLGGKRYIYPLVKDSFRDWLIPKTKQSPEWRAYLEELSAIANSEAGDGANTSIIGRLPKEVLVRMEAATAAECTTGAASQRDVTTPKPDSGGRKRGPKTDYENALRVADTVVRVAPDLDWRPKLD